METPQTPDEILFLFESRMAALGMTQAQLDAKAFGKQGTAAIQNLKKGADPAFSRVAAMARALGLELYLGMPRHAGLAEPEATHDFHSGNTGRAGYLPIPWAEPGPGKGSAPVALKAEWLDTHALIPERLSAVVPDQSLVDGVEPSRCVAILEANAPRRGAGQLWCVKAGSAILLARLAFVPGGYIIMPRQLTEAPRMITTDDPTAPRILGRVVCMAVITGG